MPNGCNYILAWASIDVVASHHMISINTPMLRSSLQVPAPPFWEAHADLDDLRGFLLARAMDGSYQPFMWEGLINPSH